PSRKPCSRDGDTGTVEVSAVRGGTTKEARLLVTVQDDGVGLPEDFDPHRSGNLGLQIVRTLVEGELGGAFDMVQAAERGCRVILDIPVPAEK
ncbi:ATP-binding protein, partial [Streptomyces violaceoruber]